MLYVHAAVDTDELASDEAGIVGTHENGSGRDVVAGTGAAHGHHGGQMSRGAMVPASMPAWAMGVSMMDGGMVLAVIPWGDSS